MVEIDNSFKIENLSFSYDNSKKILDNIDIYISSGEFLSVLGKSGCGKSTFLRLLAGLETPTKGTIYYNNKKITSPSLDRAVVFQDYGLFPWMTAGDNLMLALRQYYKTVPKIELKEKAYAALRQVGLNEDVYKLLPKHLSGGMKQRCAIAQVLSINPNSMLMDEPFGALDAVTRGKLQDLIIKLWSENTHKKTVVFVTHDVDEALLLSTRIIVLGQAPSSIIFDKKNIFTEKLNRDNLFYDKDVIEFRNELITVINKDVNERM